MSKLSLSTTLEHAPVMFEDQLDFPVAHCAQLRHNKINDSWFYSQEYQRIQIQSSFKDVLNVILFIRAHLYELNDAVGDGRLAEFLQVLDNVRGLQANAHSSIQRVGGQFILVHVDGPAHGLGDGDQEVLSILIDR